MLLHATMLRMILFWVSVGALTTCLRGILVAPPSRTTQPVASRSSRALPPSQWPGLLFTTISSVDQDRNRPAPPGRVARAFSQSRVRSSLLSTTQPPPQTQRPNLRFHTGVALRTIPRSCFNGSLPSTLQSQSQWPDLRSRTVSIGYQTPNLPKELRIAAVDLFSNLFFYGGQPAYARLFAKRREGMLGKRKAWEVLKSIKNDFELILFVQEMGMFPNKVFPFVEPVQGRVGGRNEIKLALSQLALIDRLGKPSVDASTGRNSPKVADVLHALGLAGKGRTYFSLTAPAHEAGH
jgi:hypothetical protein